LREPMCTGRVAIVTGAGQGIGRSEAMALAREGARVVVNDVAPSSDGTFSAAERVVADIAALGGVAVANHDDVADEAGAERLVDQAVEQFGRIDVLVNNAGILRNAPLHEMAVADWDAVLRVNLRGHFLPLRAAARHWQAQAAAGQQLDARIINTSSGSGLIGIAGQGNYGCSKAAVAALTIVAAEELTPIGVTVNALCPHADTPMTLRLPDRQQPKNPVDGWDPRDPDTVTPLVVWLAAPESRDVTGRVFDLGGGYLMAWEPWQYGASVDKGAPWDPSELGPVVRSLMSNSAGRPALDNPPWPH
jgi:NAD(P)-dependent dehydrogenase (short-subunit alcohol dehydrogenase family)